MSATDRVAGRWTRTAELPAPRGVRRWRALDAQGRPVELIAPVLTGGAGGAAFLRAHRALAAAWPDPGIVETHAIVDDQDPPVVARAALHDRALDALKGTLPPGTVAELGARLLPVLLRLGPELGGAVLLSDLGVDATGRIVLAPLGPMASRVHRGVLGSVAPELHAGGEPDGQATLFGLGAVLYRLAAGRLPPVGGVPPSPSSWNHRVPPELDRAILRLLSPKPEDRPGALPDLVAASGPPQDPRTLLDTTPARAVAPAHATARPTQSPGLWLDPVGLAALGPRERSVAAGLAGVPVAALDDLARAGLPLVLAQNDTATRGLAAGAFGRELEIPPKPSRGWIAWIASSALLAVGAAAAAIAGAFGGPLAALPGAALALAGIGIAGVRVGRSRGIAAQVRAVEAGWRSLEAVRGDRERWPAVAAVDQRIARLRVDLAAADLPGEVERDVREAVKEIEGRVASALGVLHTAERALASVDRTQLALRLQALSKSAQPSDRAALDQVTRTTADLADLETRRDRQLALVQELGAALDELAASLATPEATTHDAAEALSRATRTARLLRERTDGG